MTRPVIAVSADSLALAEQLSGRLGQTHDVVVIGSGHSFTDWQHVQPDMVDMTTGLTFSQAAGPKHLQPRPDIEAWNQRVEAEKLAKRHAKGKP